MKRTLVILISLLLVGGAALAWTFAPARLEVMAALPAELPRADSPPGMSLSALPTGSMTARAALAYRGGAFSDERVFSMTPILVRHPRGDLLFDTGFGRNLEAHLALQPALLRATTNYTKGKTVVEQLAAQGYETRQLAGVVLTHSHWDHVSGLDDMPGAAVWVNAAERDFIATGGFRTAVARGLEKLDFKSYEFDNGPYLGFPRSHDVWGDGSIVLVPAGGHMPGSVLAFITMPSGVRYALLGDLVWQNEGIELPAERPWLSRTLVDVDEELVRQNIDRVAAIHKRFPQVVMIPAHDARANGALPVFPAALR